MAFLYSRSKTWRRIVQTTQSSGYYMAAFAGACLAGSLLLGDQVSAHTRARGSRCISCLSEWVIRLCFFLVLCYYAEQGEGRLCPFLLTWCVCHAPSPTRHPGAR